MNQREFKELFFEYQKDLEKVATELKDVDLLKYKKNLLENLYQTYRDPDWENKVKLICNAYQFPSSGRDSLFYRELEYKKDEFLNSEDFELAELRKRYKVFDHSLAEWEDFFILAKRITEKLYARRDSEDKGIAVNDLEPFPFEIKKVA